MTIKTRDQVQATKEKAVRFVRDVLGDNEHADEIEDRSIEDYAERKRIKIVNPQRRKEKLMAQKRTGTALSNLKKRVQELEEENEALQNQLDTIREVVNEEEEHDDGEGEEEEDDDD